MSVFLANFLWLCASLFGHLANWDLPTCVCVCVGQMPFPPEYLASPPERLKKEKKPKTPKNKKEATGKVREEKERLDAWICKKKNQSLQPFQEINF